MTGAPDAGPGAPVRPVVRVFVSAGSNIEPERHLRRACEELQQRFGRLTLSSVYRNAPFDFEGDDFLNLVIGFSTTESPHEILAELERLHRQAGRVRGAAAFSSRTLDLDLLLYGDEIITDGALRVPREDITKYGFVLGPLAEMAPDLRHPVTGERVAAMWRNFDRAAHPLERTALRLV